MEMSDKGVEFMYSVEGYEEKMYLDQAGLPTIGCGHLLTKDELMSGKIRLPDKVLYWKDAQLSPEDVHDLLRNDLSKAESAVRVFVEVDLTQTEFDALVSFVFNIGVGAFQHSQLLRLLNRNMFDTIPGQMRRWVYCAGKPSSGLYHRRAREVKLWELGDYGT